MIIPKTFELHHYNQKADFLKPCPFCGNVVDIYKIGNDYSKSKKVEIHCRSCGYLFSKASLKDFDTAFKYVCSRWEKRA